MERSSSSFDDLDHVREQQREDDLVAIRNGIAEANAGLGRPFDEIDAEICRKFGWTFEE